MLRDLMTGKVASPEVYALADAIAQAVEQNAAVLGFVRDILERALAPAVGGGGRAPGGHAHGIADNTVD